MWSRYIFIKKEVWWYRLFCPGKEDGGPCGLPCPGKEDGGPCADATGIPSFSTYCRESCNNYCNSNSYYCKCSLLFHHWLCMIFSYMGFYFYHFFTKKSNLEENI